MKRLLMFMMTLGIVYACEKSETNDQAADRELMQEMKKEIMDRIDAVPCENAEDWRPEPLGSKSCGGPPEYIAYPHAADASGELLELINTYTEFEKEYNEKYNIISDCGAIVSPTDVICVDGKPKLMTRMPD